VISLTLATLSDSEVDEMHAVCSTNRLYWHCSGDLDPGDISREAVEVMLHDEAEAGGCELLAARDVTGRLVGFAQVLRRHPADGHPWIGLLLVDGRLRRQGHGSAIAAVLEERFCREGALGVRLGILENNIEAQRFWTALGYREIDRRPDLAKGRPTLVMHKDLRS
jgi:ribosomal protein S18 acetylase RimI-like enzyme